MCAGRGQELGDVGSGTDRVREGKGDKGRKGVLGDGAE